MNVSYECFDFDTGSPLYSTQKKHFLDSKLGFEAQAIPQQKQNKEIPLKIKSHYNLPWWFFNHLEATLQAP